ncbi:MAG TPA: ATP synthase subunit I [Methylotenera sp.]|nr:ATP synthase subunit I [Methylotenera sp.]
MDNSNNGLATNKVFSEMLRWQLSATAVVAVGALLISGLHAGVSAVAGGLSVVIGAFVASKIAQRHKKDASAILINLLKAEAVKILVIVVLLFITFKVYKQLVPFALIVGLAAAALFSGAAISKLNDDAQQ